MQDKHSFLCRSVLALWLLALFALAGPAQAQAPLNPNGGSVTGTLDATHTVLTYSYTVTKDEDATLTLTTSAGLTAYVRFYDSDGTSDLLDTFVNSSSTGTLGVAHLGPGTYFVHVTLINGAGNFTLGSAVTLPAAANDTEPNDDYTHAHAFAPNTTTTGHLGYSRTAYGDVDNADWYSFVAPQDGDVTFKLTTDSVFPLNAYVRFYDSNGTSDLFDAFANTNTSNAITVGHLAPGATYYVAVTRNNLWGGYTLKNVVTPPAVANDAEVNDDYKHALTYTFGSTVTGHLGYSRTAYGDVDNADWYAFSVPKDGDATFTLTTDSVFPLNAYVRFYDSNGTSEINNAFANTNNSNTLTVPHLAPGTTYYVAVTRNNYWGGYTLTSSEALPAITTAATLNNTPATALPFAVGGTVTGHLGYSFGTYAGVNSVVWYKYVASQDGDVTFTLTTDLTKNSGGNYEFPLNAYVRFYDSDGSNQINNAFANTNSSNTLTVGHLAPGATYYVAVTLNNYYGGYTLKNVVTPPSVANDREVNDDYTHALTYTVGSTVTGHLGYSRTAYTDVDNADYYAMTVPQNGDVTFTLTTDSTLSLNAYVRFYDSDGTSQINNAFANTNNSNTLTVPHLAPGATYYVAVTRNNYWGGYTLSSVLTPVVNAISPAPGTTPGTAATFAPDTSVTGNLGYSTSSYYGQTNVAWYSFVAPRDSDVAFTLATDTLLPLRAYVRFFNSDGTSEINNVFVGANASNTLNIGHLAPGATYYVEVTRYDGYGGYTLSNTVAPLYVANDAEINDAAAQATALANLSNITGHLGYSRTSYFDQDNADWYKIALPVGPFSANISVSGSLRTYLRLYAPDGSSELTNVFNGGGTSALSYNVATAGTYYLAVTRYDGYGAYDINQPVTATVYGTATLEQIAQFAPAQTINVDFRTPGTTTVLFTRQISVGYNGAYFISNVPRGKYTLAFKGAKWLRKVVTGIDVTVGDANGVNVFLKGADANNDNSVDTSDFGILVGSYGSDASVNGSGYDVRADFNCDGVVDTTDFGVLVGEYGQKGDN